jgi:hypothetical protein
LKVPVAVSYVRSVTVIDERWRGVKVVLMTNKIRQIPQDLIRLLWDTYLELLTFTLIDRTNRRRYIRHKMVEDELDSMGYDNPRYGPGF